MHLIQALTTLVLLHVRNAIHKSGYFVISYSYFKQHRTCGAVCFDALILKIIFKNASAFLLRGARHAIA